jgi:hypothetical protein
MAKVVGWDMRLRGRGALEEAKKGELIDRKTCK